MVEVGSNTMRSIGERGQGTSMGTVRVGGTTIRRVRFGNTIIITRITNHTLNMRRYSSPRTQGLRMLT